MPPTSIPLLEFPMQRQCCSCRYSQDQGQLRHKRARIHEIDVNIVEKNEVGKTPACCKKEINENHEIKVHRWRKFELLLFHIEEKRSSSLVCTRADLSTTSSSSTISSSLTNLQSFPRFGRFSPNTSDINIGHTKVHHIYNIMFGLDGFWHFRIAKRAYSVHIKRAVVIQIA